jgi:peptidoglycan/LPS O-acetylase OafA/YrhL
MKTPSPDTVIRFSCVLALAALALIVWSMVDPRPIPVILAMSVGQILGTLSFATFLLVVARDLRAAQRKEATLSTKSTPDHPRI